MKWGALNGGPGTTAPSAGDGHGASQRLNSALFVCSICNLNSMQLLKSQKSSAVQFFISFTCIGVVKGV